MKNIETLALSQNLGIPLGDFVIDLFITIFLTSLLVLHYRKFGKSMSNRDQFSHNFLFLSTTTMLVITIVKSSLALSLGLVGALSIVRFRTAIKEPEELTYLFLCIAIGLGLGANQRLITITGFFIIAGILILYNFRKIPLDRQNLHLVIKIKNPGKQELSNIVEILKKSCTKIEIKRFDEQEELLEVSFLIEVDGFQKLEEGKANLQGLKSIQKISFLESKSV